jgi:hypothetical protein
MARADKPFSQLDFDRPTAAIEAPRKPTEEDLKVILDAAGTPAVAGVPPLAPVAKPPAKSSPKSDTTSRARLSAPEARSPSDSRFDWVKPEDGASHFLVPRLKGPMVDPEIRRRLQRPPPGSAKGPPVRMLLPQTVYAAKPSRCESYSIVSLEATTFITPSAARPARIRETGRCSSASQ